MPQRTSSFLRRFSAALFSLLILSALFGSPTAQAQRGPRPGTQTGGGQAVPVYDRTFEYGPGMTVRIENPQGNTSVEVWGESFTHVAASRDKAESRVFPSEIVFVTGRTQLTIRCTPKTDGSPIGLKVFLPRASHLRMVSDSGDVEIIGPIASATAETDSGNILFESPRSMNADLTLHSDSGRVGSVTLASYVERSSNTIKGNLGMGGGSVLLRSGSGDVNVKPLRGSVVVAADQNPRSGPQPAQPTRASDTGNGSIFPDPDTQPSDRPMTDIFGGSQQQNSDVSRRGTDSRGQYGGSDDSTLSGSVGARIIYPRGYPRGTPSGNGSPTTGSPRNDAPPDSSRRGAQTPAADEVLNNLPRRDPANSAPDGSGRPTLRRNGANGSNPGDGNGKESETGNSDPDAITVDSKLVNLNAVVTTADGRAITNLNQGDFEIFEDDVKQEVAHFAPTSTPFNLVLLLDLSGSTREKIDSIRKSALSFVEATNGQDRVSIVTFTRSFHVLCRPTTDRALLRDRIKEMRATDGGTAFYEAVWFTLEDVLGPFPNERNAVVVMTDGVDNSISAAYPAPSRVSFRQMVDRILESGTLVYPIYLDTEQENYEFHWGETNEVYSLARTRLQQMADASGGVLHLARNIEDLAGVYQKIIAELRTVYSLGYYPSSTAADGKWHRIRVRAPKSESVIRTRRGYYAK
jgi:VWFA-related protein